MECQLKRKEIIKYTKSPFIRKHNKCIKVFSFCCCSRSSCQNNKDSFIYSSPIKPDFVLYIFNAQWVFGLELGSHEIVTNHRLKYHKCRLQKTFSSTLRLSYNMREIFFFTLNSHHHHRFISHSYMFRKCVTFTVIITQIIRNCSNITSICN